MDAKPDPSGPQHLEGMQVGSAREREGSADPARPAGGGHGRRIAAGHDHGGRRHGQQPRRHVRECRAAGQVVRGHTDGVRRPVPQGVPLNLTLSLDIGRGGGFTRPRAEEQHPDDHPREHAGERAEGRRQDGAQKAGACVTPPSRVLPAPHGRRW